MGRREFTMRDLLEIYEHWQAGDSLRSMERNLGVDRHTLRKYIGAAEEAGIGRQPPLSRAQWQSFIREKGLRRRQGTDTKSGAALAPYQERILAGLKSNTVSTVWQRLVDDTEMEVSLSTFRRYCAGLDLEPDPSKVTVWRPEVPPGEEAQVDFGLMGRWVNPRTGLKEKVWAFSMVLAYSRYQFVFYTTKLDVAAWTTAHVRAFEWFKGVPERVNLDNLKDGVIKPSLYDPQFNRSYQELAAYYGCLIDPSRIEHPKDKARVERQMPYIRDSAWRGQDYATIEDANCGALRWCQNVAGQRIHGTTGQRPYEMFLAEEQQKLRELPPIPWELALWQTAKVGLDSHCNVLRGLYSVPWQLVGQELDVRCTQTQVEFYTQDRNCVKSHSRVAARKRQTDITDLPPEKVAFYVRNPSWCKDQAIRYGPYVSQAIDCILSINTLTHLRQAQQILRFGETYGGERLNAACQRALFFEDCRYLTIKGILEKALDQESLPCKSPKSDVICKAHLRGPSAFSTAPFEQ